MKETNWIVITGAPCSGKTAVIDGLESRGYRVVHEVARAYIDACLRKGRTLAQIKSDPLAFERQILYRKAAVEAGLPAEQTVFLDRAIPDSIAYYIVERLNPAEAIRRSRRFRYRNVFIFDPLEYDIDRVRSEDKRLAARLDAELELGYRYLGYEPVRVPVMPVEKRLQLVLGAAKADSADAMPD